MRVKHVTNAQQAAGRPVTALCLDARRHAPEQLLADAILPSHHVSRQSAVGVIIAHAVNGVWTALVQHRLVQRRVDVAHVQHVVVGARPAMSLWQQQVPVRVLGDTAPADRRQSASDVALSVKHVELGDGLDCNACDRLVRQWTSNQTISVPESRQTRHTRDSP